MIKPTPTEQEVLLASEALRLMNEQHLKPVRACDQAVFGQGENHNYTEEGGKLFHHVLRNLHELIRQRRRESQQMTFSFSCSAATRRG